jgi:hypothetical protein
MAHGTIESVENSQLGRRHIPSLSVGKGAPLLSFLNSNRKIGSSR